MRKKVLLLIVAIVFLLQLKTQVHNTNVTYTKLFEKAEALFNGNANEQTDSIALGYYNTIIKNVLPSSQSALLLYNCHERTGILQQGLSGNSQEELQNFYAALHIYRTYKLADSLLFRLLLSTGNAHYNDGLFDSSIYYFSRAEKIIEKYPAAGHAEDLYNSLGALYSESGNYRQSITHFSKALEIIRATRPNFREADFAMSMNIASALRLSGRLDSAIFLYKKLLQSANTSTPLLNNLGRIYLSKKMLTALCITCKK